MSKVMSNDISSNIGKEVLVVKDLKKRYNKNADFTVKGLSFVCHEGEVVGIVGRNGAGKSTTIKCITGLHPFDEGEISICGFDIVKEPIKAKYHLGYVPDVSLAFDKMTGIEYLNFIADIFGIDSDVRKERIEKLDSAFGLNNALYRLINSYSHGMKQKISVMASILPEPDLWILDEPLTGLDPQTSSVLKKLMKDYATKGHTVIFSSHNLDVVEKLCDRVIIISEGSLVKDMDRAEIEALGTSLEEYFVNNTFDGDDL